MQNPSARDVSSALKKAGTTDRAKSNAWFFKTGPGEYAEGDEFIGVRVPDVRKVVKEYRTLPFPVLEIKKKKKKHEERLAALLILVDQYQKADELKKKIIFDFYLAHTRSINNWDLVDSSAPYISGAYLWKRNRSILGQMT